MGRNLDERRRQWSLHSTALAVMDDDEFGRLVDRTQINRWGASSDATLPDGSRVFVKRLPLTDVERDHAYSTRNHFQLPVFYQYGVGSAGFGVWRELATHVKTTGWVVDGSCAAFPMLLYHRVMPRAASPRKQQETWVESDEYIAYWNGSKRLASFIDARQSCSHELWLVLEHVPHRMFEWIVENQGSAGDVVDAQIATLRFLHDEGVFHFDAHFGNVVTDGSTPMLTDFGLATDRAFRLSAGEREFVDRHAHYDFGETIYSVGNAVLGLLALLPRDEGMAIITHFVDEIPRDHDAIIEILVRNIEALADDGVLGVSQAYADVVVRYREVIRFMSEFFFALRSNRRKNTFFDDARLAALLADAGVVVD